MTAAKFTRTRDSSSRPVTNTASYQDIGRVADFMQGVRESRDQRAKTAAIMVGAYVGVRALQHWSAWKRQQGR